MNPTIQSHLQPTPEILTLLTQHLPHSLPTLRRLQLMKINGGQTPNSHVLSTFDEDDNFLVAFLDFEKGPNTEMWIYSSFEKALDDEEKEKICEAQMLKLLDKVKEIEREYIKIAKKPRENEGIMLIGSLHSAIVKILERHGFVKSLSPEHDKFVFRMDGISVVKELEKGLKWGVVGDERIGLVLERTSIPYTAESMKVLYSVAIETEEGVMVAWAFLGLDGSLKTLHVEEEYRGRGLAKAVALRLFHEASALDLAPDGLFHADVAFNNAQSQGVCKSLKGKKEWSIYYTWVFII